MSELHAGSPDSTRGSWLMKLMVGSTVVMAASTAEGALSDIPGWLSKSGAGELEAPPVVQAECRDSSRPLAASLEWDAFGQDLPAGARDKILAEREKTLCVTIPDPATRADLKHLLREALPDPDSADYADCLEGMTAELRGFDLAHLGKGSALALDFPPELRQSCPDASFIHVQAHVVPDGHGSYVVEILKVESGG